MYFNDKIIRRSLFLAVVITSLLEPACTRDVNLDAIEKRQVVVECILVNGPEQTLRLCFGQGASETSLSYISEAEAVLTDLSEGTVSGTFKHVYDGTWTLSYSAVPGHSYRLDISVSGYNPIYAEQTMPEIDVEAVYYSSLFEDHNLCEYNYSPHIVYRLSSLPEYTWIYALRYDEATGKRVIAEEICTDFPYVDNFNLTGAQYSPEVHLRERWGLPCYMAIAPDLIGYNMHNRFLRIPNPGDVDKNWLILSGIFGGEFPIRFMNDKYGGRLVDDGKVKELGEKQGCVVFVGVSEDFDIYLRDAIYFQQMQESSDFASIYVRDNIFSNINGGIGLFGAKSEEMMVWSDEEELIDVYDSSEDI